MDNFEDIVVILFIVISILSSLLKSKKEKAKKQAPAKTGYKPVPEKKQKKTDILSEVDAWFKNQFPEDLVKSEPEKQKPVRQAEYIKPRQHTIPEKVYMKSEPVKIKESANKPSANYKASKISSKLKSKNSLKEYIIFNEILGKPKSLRDY